MLQRWTWVLVVTAAHTLRVTPMVHVQLSIRSEGDKIMLEPSEVQRCDDGRLCATLSAIDRRTRHVQSVLKARDGEPVRIGVVDGGLLDDATITWQEPAKLPEDALPPDIPGRKADRKAAPDWKDLVLELGRNEQLLHEVAEDKRPKVALLLALPRPLQLERILPMVSSLGVSTLVLCGASKVEKMYFGSHLFRDPPAMRERLIEGLSQIQDLLGRRSREAVSPRPLGCNPEDAGVLVSVGPEGGWVEPDELELLSSFGFQAVTLGPRVLRSDVAVCALLALAHSWVQDRSAARDKSLRTSSTAPEQ